MKKGFTLVELAIVLIIIGVLMAGAIEGRSLIFSTQDRTEAARLVNFVRAVKSYESFSGRKFTWNSGGVANIDIMVTDKYVTSEELTTYFKVPGGDNKLGYFKISPATDGYNPGAGYPDHGSGCRFYVSSTTSKQCALNHRTICVYEQTLDDNSVTSGKGYYNKFDSNFMQRCENRDYESSGYYGYYFLIDSDSIL